MTTERMWNQKRAVGRILIAGLPIRNRSNPNALNKNPISNRPKKTVFREPATYNLEPATYLSNRNCKELKIDVTL